LGITKGSNLGREKRTLFGEQKMPHKNLSPRKGEFVRKGGILGETPKFWEKKTPNPDMGKPGKPKHFAKTGHRKAPKRKGAL